MNTTGYIVAGGLVIVVLGGVYFIVSANNQAITSSSVPNNVGSQTQTPIWQQIVSGVTFGLVSGLRTGSSRDDSTKVNGVTRTNGASASITRNDTNSPFGADAVGTSHGSAFSRIAGAFA